MALRILVLGGGGREHALVWKLNQSRLVDHIFVSPGNGGTELSSKVSNVILPDPTFQNLSKWAVENDVNPTSSCIQNADSVPFKINLVIPGPEQPLVDGVESHFRKGAFHTSQSHHPPSFLPEFTPRICNSRDPCLWPYRPRRTDGRV
jgi:phosphoribosylamine--glycine ligase / phosphoribosylformylglycinamidine cyclo-ligase